MSKNLARLREAAHTSVSRLKTYLACPKRYFLGYIDGVAPQYKPVAFPFGQAFHEAAQHHLLTGDGPDHQAEVHDIFRSSLEAAVHADGVPVLFEEEEQDLGAVVDQGIRMLDCFIEKVLRPDGVLAVEAAFSLELAHPITGEILPVPLIGAMDALVLEAGKPVVWELKTAKKRWSADQLELDPQPTAYRMGARQLGVEEAELKLLVTTKTKKPDVQVEKLVRTRVDERELGELAWTVHRAVQAGIDHRARGWQCRSCPYASACSV